MGTGGVPALLGAGAVAALLTVAGCADSASSAAPAPASTSAPATPPEDLCARLVAHWSREVIDADTYGDYQSMGLPNGQYDLLVRIVDAARAEKKREGAEAADLLIDRQARQGCVEWYRDGGPGEGPWQ